MSSILFLGKAHDEHCARALAFARQHFDVTAGLGVWGDPLPQAALTWAGDYIISYLSRWVVPRWLLHRSRVAAINFHPAPPEYPGAGCNNFALYDGATVYGVTCHYMAPAVDTGPIIAVKRFAIYPSDDVASLLARSYDQQLVLYYEIMELLIAGAQLPRSAAIWTREAYRKADIDLLATITGDMDREEIARRVRATTFGDWAPEIVLQGYRFRLVQDG
jgi:methionyl-tRNA formyltransferase